VFPTTIWTTIHKAGARDREAEAAFARAYRAPVLAFVRSRGFAAEDADDICQDVFVRVLSGRVLARADADRGRFRSLLLAVTSHVIQDRLRRRREPSAGDTELVEPEAAERDPEFDRAWVLHLAERAMALLRESAPRHYAVIAGHLSGERQDRNKLWVARRRLVARIRDEIATTCASHEAFQVEVDYLAQYLRPTEKSERNDETPSAGRRTSGR
jgi:DNA-directed RNA polymerase specialized sigma24 family protein